MFLENGYRVEIASLGKLTFNPLSIINTNISTVILNLLAATCQIIEALSGNCQGMKSTSKI